MYSTLTRRCARRTTWGKENGKPLILDVAMRIDDVLGSVLSLNCIDKLYIIDNLPNDWRRDLKKESFS